MRRKHIIIVVSIIALLVAAGWAALLGMEAHPVITADDWVKDPDMAAKTAAAAAEQARGLGAAGWGSILVSAGLTLLAGFRRYGHLIPYLGPWWKAAVDIGWTVAQTKDAREADAAKERIALAASPAKAAIQSIRTIMPDTWGRLPLEIRASLEGLEKV